MLKTVLRPALIVAIFSISFFVIQAQVPKDSGLKPLTAKERALDYRAIIANQPDFSADRIFFQFGKSSSSRLTRIGNRFRRGSGEYVEIGNAGEIPIRLNETIKVYNDIELATEQTPTGFEDYDPKLLAKSDNEFIPIGRQKIEGHDCIKVRVKWKRRSFLDELFLYIAKDLDNLVMAIERKVEGTAIDGRSFSHRTDILLRNIELDPDPSLVQIPADYKPVDRVNWSKMENAAVRVNGKTVDESAVFRSPEGNLYVCFGLVGEFLVRPEAGIAAKAFGVVVDSRRSFICWSKEAEGVSETFYRGKEYIDRTKEESSSLEIAPGLIKFQPAGSTDVWIEILLDTSVEIQR